MSKFPTSEDSGRILVTGAGGFIGSHLVEQLLGQGHPVRALLRYTSDCRLGQLEDLVRQLREVHVEEPACNLAPNAVQLGPLEIVWGDICDGTGMRPVCEDIWGVCHLAALIGIPYSYVAPGSYVQVNIVGTLNLLERAREGGVKRFIQTSTSEVYGTASYTPIDLAHPLKGQSPYAATKIGADKLAESFANSFGMNVTVLRPFNTYGPRQSLRAVIPSIITQALAGDTIQLGNLEAVRDFTYVSDTCEAYRLALENTLEPGTTIHLGTGEAVSIREVVQYIEEILDQKILVETSRARLRPPGSEVEVLVSDPSVAQHTIGWAPSVTLREGLARTVEWSRSHSPRDERRYHV